MKIISHLSLGLTPFSRSRELLALIKARKISWGGNKRLKIYGTLTCWSGKRMKPENRVFFASKADANRHGYRPCKHCKPH